MANQYTPFRFLSETHKECSMCGEILPHSDFYSSDKKSLRNNGLSYYCKECTKANSRNNHNARVKIDPEYKRSKKDQYIRYTYGITLQEYEEKLVQQGNLCAICGSHLPSTGPLTHLDHDHKTGRLRAFLCTLCNKGLGSFRDNTEFLNKAINYLSTHSSNVDGKEKEFPNESTH
jgi:hypothetical protein